MRPQGEIHAEKTACRTTKKQLFLLSPMALREKYPMLLGCIKLLTKVRKRRERGENTVRFRDLLDESFKHGGVFTVADILSDRGLAESRVIHQETGHLFGE